MRRCSRDQLFQILEDGDFPKTAKMITITALRMALKRHFRRLVMTIKAANVFSQACLPRFSWRKYAPDSALWFSMFPVVGDDF